MGESVADAPPPPSGPMTPGPSLAELYVKHKMQGASELDAALKASAQMRQQADARGGLRDATDLFVGLGKTPLTGDAHATMLHEQAAAPLKDFVARHAQREDALKQAVQEGQLRMNDFASQQAMAQMSPEHPTNRVLQQAFAKAMPSLPPEIIGRLTVANAPQLLPAFKGLSEYAEKAAGTAKTGEEAATIAATRPGTVAKGEAEAEKIKTMTPAEYAALQAGTRKTRDEAATIEAGLPSAGPAAAAGVKLKEAEARKAGAESGKVEMETGGTVAKGSDGTEWKVRGDIGVNQAARDEFKNKLESTDKINHNIDEILGILGDRNIITNPMERAKVQPRLSQITKGLAHETGQRGLPQQDIEFFGSMTGDPTKFSVANITGLSEAATRLKTLRAMANEDLSRHAQTHGIVPAKGAEPAAAPKGKALTPSEMQMLRKIAADPKDKRSTAAILRLKMAEMK